MTSLAERARRQVGSIRHMREEALALLQRVGFVQKNLNAISEGLTPQSSFPLQAKCPTELRVAAIMDRFTLDSYAPECELQELTPTGWREEIDRFHPEIVFVESAWQGKDGLWYRKIANGSKEYFDMTDYCHQQKIPIVFWNKEDPVYTTTFLPAAHAADFVFTTDIDCIEQYKTALGHDRVFHLHFAAQPKIHNPIEKYNRSVKFCFAGAYYHRYPQRAKVFDDFAEVFLHREGLNIYDRNYGNARPEHAFPERYSPIILGKLEPSEIDKAYKGYIYGINMNSVNQSQSMFARRVFEMMASNTITVSNYARGLKNYFGDLTLCTDNPCMLENALERYAGDMTLARKYRLQGLRCVLKSHLYEDRLSYIINKVFGKDILPKMPWVHVLGIAQDEKTARRVIAMFKVQTYTNKKMTLFSDCIQTDEPHIQVLPLSKLKGKNVATFVSQQHYTAAFCVDDWYGENYLMDLMLALRYGDYMGIGKKAMFAVQDGLIVCADIECAYKAVQDLLSVSAVLHGSLCGSYDIRAFCEGTKIEGGSLFAVDEFNYCRGFTGDVCEAAQDLYIADQGIALSEIESAAESIRGTLIVAEEDSLQITGEQIAAVPLPNDGMLELSVSNDGCELISKLPESKHVYIYKKEHIALGEFLHEGKLPIYFQGASNLDLICVCIFYDKRGKKIAPMFPKLNRMEILEVPAGAIFVQVGLRVKGSGEATLKRITLGKSHETDRLATFLSRSDTLVLTNHYPSYEALYRNMFVHKRMTAYKGAGKVFDIFRMNIYAQDGYREFEDINVIEGHAEALDSVLSNGRIKTVCVHFLDEDMWSVLKGHLDHVRIIIWIHGSEIQPWWRRTFNYHNDKELKEAKEISNKMMAFWEDIFSEKEGIPVHFVFVSKYFANEVMEDHKINLSLERYSIIHNHIDTDMFSYDRKPLEQRKKILSIKPFASAKYGNDITTKAIVELSKESFFKDLEFFIYGDGACFDKDNAPLKNLGSNVHLYKTFLQQANIAMLHKQCGVYIATTRMDAQGVSRDEAMSSGLVPIASNVTAIPEFVDDTCGILVPGEDSHAVAEAIKRLYKEPDLFERLSEGAARRVRSQTSRPYTIDREIELIEQKHNS